MFIVGSSDISTCLVDTDYNRPRPGLALESGFTLYLYRLSRSSSVTHWISKPHQSVTDQQLNVVLFL